VSGTLFRPVRRTGRLVLFAVLVAAVAFATGVPIAAGGYQAHKTVAVSVSSDRVFGNEDSYDGWASDDGRYVVFESWAWNLAPGDDNAFGDGGRDIYLRDTVENKTWLVSGPRVGGTENDRGSRDPSISDDGRYVCFFTGQDLVASDTNGDQDIYVYDRVNDTYKRLDVMGDGSSPMDDNWDFQISGDGMYVVWESDEAILPEDTNGTNRRDIYAYDVAADHTILVSEPRVGAVEWDRGSRDPSISDNGRYVAFLSGQDFVAGDTNNEQDLYIKDLQSGTYTRADVVGDGTTDIQDDNWDFFMSGDGKYVVWESREVLLAEDTNGTTRDIYLYDVDADTGMLVTEPRAGASEPNRGSRDASISDDGEWVMFFSGQDFVPEDTNGEQDLYVWNMTSGEFTLVDLGMGPDGRDEVWDIRIAGDGIHYVFGSYLPYFDTSATDGNDQIYLGKLGSPFAAGSTRIAGANRYATAIASSQQAFPLGARTVVVATGANWPDALGGSALAGAVDGPILLTTPTDLPDSVKAEIMRLGASRAYILGGYGAVSGAVELELNAMLAGSVKRLGGVDRYATSQLVANQVMNILGESYEGTACVATGRVYADAMAAAPVASGLGWPILLANPTAGSVDVPSRVEGAVVLGGVGAVPAAIMTDAETKLGAANVLRLGGATRYNTAALIAEHGAEQGLMWNGVGIARGDEFPDALAGGAALGLQQTVLLLTPTNSLAAPTQTALNDNKSDIMSVNFLGGTGAVSAAVEAQIKTLLGM